MMHQMDIKAMMTPRLAYLKLLLKPERFDLSLCFEIKIVIYAMYSEPRIYCKENYWQNGE